VEVPTAPAELVTGLVLTGLVVGAAPARLMSTTESSPTRARATRILCFTTLFPPVESETGHKGWSLDQSAAPHKLGWPGGFLVWLGCAMEQVWRVRRGDSVQSGAQFPQK
jgi:hypothetical protein